MVSLVLIAMTLLVVVVTIHMSVRNMMKMIHFCRIWRAQKQSNAILNAGLGGKAVEGVVTPPAQQLQVVQEERESLA